MVTDRRGVFRWLLAGLAAAQGRVAFAQAGEGKVIEWVHPYPAGGGSDAIARKLAAHAPNAPTPGNTTRSAPRTASGSAVTTTSAAPATRSAFSTE